jgi:hypothetical protein
MRKSIIFICLFLSACAGNPPEWWNPGNHYVPQTTGPEKTLTNTLPPKTEETFSFETDIDYEEMAISPEEANEQAAAQSADTTDALVPSMLTE